MPPVPQAQSRHQACDLRAVSCIFAGISALINYGLISQSNSYNAMAERGAQKEAEKEAEKDCVGCCTNPLRFVRCNRCRCMSLSMSINYSKSSQSSTCQTCHSMSAGEQRVSLVSLDNKRSHVPLSQPCQTVARRAWRELQSVEIEWLIKSQAGRAIDR